MNYESIDCSTVYLKVFSDLELIFACAVTFTAWGGKEN